MLTVVKRWKSLLADQICRADVIESNGKVIHGDKEDEKEVVE